MDWQDEGTVTMSRGPIRTTTRYSFATTQGERQGWKTKTCPRCGQELFDDMDTCYGCLYDFTRDGVDAPQPTTVRGGRPAATPGTGASRSADPLASIELDEPSDVDLDGSDGTAADQDITAPRHRRTASSDGQDTLDLSQAKEALEGQAAPADEPGFTVWVCGKDVRAGIPLSEQGLSIGRDAENDVVLRSRCVSRHHLRLERRGDRVLVRDLGSTNPAEVNGAPLEGESLLSDGDEVDICGTVLRVLARDGTRESAHDEG